MTRDTRVYCPPAGVPYPAPAQLRRDSRLTCYTLGLDALPYSTSCRVFRGASIYPRSRVFNVPPHATGVRPCGLYGPPAMRGYLIRVTMKIEASIHTTTTAIRI